MDKLDIEGVIERMDRTHFHIVYNGTLVIVEGEGRLFVFNRLNRRTYEIIADFETGIALSAL